MEPARLQQVFAPFQNSRTAVTVSDMGAKDQPLVFVNKGFEAATGYKADDVIGRNCRFLQGPDTNPETITAIRSAIKAGKGINVCLANYRADGSLFHNLLFIAPITIDDGAQLFLGCQYDISDRIQFANIGDHIAQLNGLVDRLRAQPKTTWQVHMDTSHLIAHMMTSQAKYYLETVGA